MLRIGILTSSVSHRGGGVFEATRGLVANLVRQTGVTVSVVGLADDLADRDRDLWDGVAMQTLTAWRTAGLAYAPKLGPALARIDSDVLHQHGIWMYPSVAAERWQRRFGRPRLISPHGMLNPAALALSRIKKTAAYYGYEARSLRMASCFHALGTVEAAALRRCGMTQPIAVIPSGVDLPGPEVLERTSPVGARRTLLFLGRLCANKGVLELIEAWGLLAARREPALCSWSLSIVGWGAEDFVAQVHRRIAALDLAESVSFLGPRFGTAKECAFLEAGGLVLPSAFESLPMAILEAWAYRLPVLMTEACNLPEGLAVGAALRVESEPSSLASSLLEFFARSDQERTEMGAQGRRHVERAHQWSMIAKRYVTLYAWLLNGGDAPEFVWTG